MIFLFLGFAAFDGGERKPGSRQVAKNMIDRRDLSEFIGGVLMKVFKLLFADHRFFVFSYYRA